MFVFSNWREPMASDEESTSGSRPAGGNDPHARPPTPPATSTSRLPNSDSRLVIDGHTFWRARTASSAIELTTATGIDVDPERCRWTVSAPGSRESAEPVESRSRDVYRFMAGVLGSMQRKPGPTASCATAPALSRSGWPANGWMSVGECSPRSR